MAALPAVARIALLCSVVVVLVGMQAASGDELTPTRTFASGAAVESPTLGVAFVMPAGWVGSPVRIRTSRCL
jgi:hypothetical protein